jgi:uncharacterized membrane protein YqiK
VVSGAEQALIAAAARAAKAEAAEKIAAAKAAKKAAAAQRTAAAKAAATLREERALAKKEHRRFVPPTTTSTTTTTLVPTTTTVPFADVTALPELQPGISVTSGVAAGAKAWVISGGESDKNASEVVVIDNLGKANATVRLDELTGTGPPEASGVPLPSLSAVEVPAGAIVTLNLAPLLGTVADLPLLISSGAPIVVGELLYNRNRPGEAIVAAVPVS